MYVLVLVFVFVYTGTYLPRYTTHVQPFFLSILVHTYLNKQHHAHAYSALNKAHHINLCAFPFSLDHSKVQLRKIYPVTVLIVRNQMVSNRRR